MEVSQNRHYTVMKRANLRFWEYLKMEEMREGTKDSKAIGAGGTTTAHPGWDRAELHLQWCQAISLPYVKIALANKY